jgi:serine phosphatase RsbU (regulator of sigma subunit)
MNYAHRSQYALLANKNLVDEILAENFIFFRPKDIVSGDFYWAAKKEDRFYLAVCDSTGHGVPGAFMCLLNISFLNEATNEKNIQSPDQIFNYIRKRLIENVSQDGAQDGMDGILVCFALEENKLKNITYTAANNAPLLITNSEMNVLPCDKMPVGKGEKNKDFSLHIVPFEKGSSLFLCTDGYADQFGGPKGKKFKYKQLNEKLVSMEKLSAKDQNKELESAFTNWKGQLEQVDDVLIMGIKC